MGFRSWKPGCVGLIYLPDPRTRAGQTDRPFFIADVDEDGKAQAREGPMSWNEANKRILKLSKMENKTAFAAPVDSRLERFRSQDLLILDPANQPNTASISKPPTSQEEWIDGPIREGKKIAIETLPSSEKFDSLFEKWADDSVCNALFPAQRPQQGSRIPITIKRKVAQMVEMGICFPDIKPAHFRIADWKKGKGGPYSWFSYYSSNQVIGPNWEYFVQVAAFRDLMLEHGFIPEWMKFEYHEPMQKGDMPVDIAIKVPNGPKIFVEVKETKSQWENLIHSIHEIKNKGVDLSTPDRGNDPLRKAKYIITGRPDFFVGYSPEGFDSYSVTYETVGRFTLRKAEIPSSKSRLYGTSLGNADKQRTDNLQFIKEAVDFLKNGLSSPVQVFNYLKSRRKCPEGSCNAGGCENVIALLSDPQPWKNLHDLLKWCLQWSPEFYYEWPIVTAFLIPLVAQFLTSKGISEENIRRSFKMEFTSGGRKDKFVPPCFWRKNASESVCIEKRFEGKYMCADFIFFPPLPAVVAEVKVGVPQTSKKIFGDFLKDLQKCKEWLKADASPFIQKKFQIAHFDFGLAILVDLTREKEVGNSWKAQIKEEDYIRQGIIPCLISPTSL